MLRCTVTMDEDEVEFDCDDFRRLELAAFESNILDKRCYSRLEVKRKTSDQGAPLVSQTA